MHILNSYLFSVKPGYTIQFEAVGGGTVTLLSYTKGIFITTGSPDGVIIAFDHGGNLYAAYRSNWKWIVGRKI